MHLKINLQDYLDKTDYLNQKIDGCRRAIKEATFEKDQLEREMVKALVEEDLAFLLKIDHASLKRFIRTL